MRGFKTSGARNAEEVLRKALEIKPDYAVAWYYLGVLQRKQGKFEKAEYSLKRALHFEPDLTVAREQLEAMRRGKAQ